MPVFFVNKLEWCRCAVVVKRSVRMLHERDNNKQMCHYDLFGSFDIFKCFSIHNNFFILFNE